ncbi:hypothetical protein YpMG051020_0501 [Yersinia pestis biovar Orientalis str. MG05-1020]|nr:hypothetical protein YpMG051020_0501 [Yersinia pestis biovar Orientalis str. MG05-1020]
MFSFVYPCGLKLRHRVTSQKDGLGHPFEVIDKVPATERTGRS